MRNRNSGFFNFVPVSVAMVVALCPWFFCQNIRAQDLAPEVLPAIDDGFAEATTQKAEALSNELKTLETLQKVLKDLGSPKKKPGEEDAAYLDRVNSTLKGRALAVHLLHQQFERALIAKAEIEAHLNEYENWVDALEKKLAILPAEYSKRAESLGIEITEVSREGLVLASLIAAAAERRTTRMLRSIEMSIPMTAGTWHWSCPRKPPSRRNSKVSRLFK